MFNLKQTIQQKHKNKSHEVNLRITVPLGVRCNVLSMAMTGPRLLEVIP